MNVNGSAIVSSFTGQNTKKNACNEAGPEGENNLTVAIGTSRIFSGVVYVNEKCMFCTENNTYEDRHLCVRRKLLCFIVATCL